MRRFLTPRWAIGLALAALLGIGALGVATAGRALASAPMVAAMGFGGLGGPGGFGPPSGAIPPELLALRDLPPAERFAHFKGVQVSLTDANNQPLTIVVTPGTVTAASPTSLTLAANDGTTRTYAISDKTVVRSRPSEGNPNNTPTLSPGDMVVVVTQNAETTARFIMDGNRDGFGGRHGRFGGPWGGR